MLEIGIIFYILALDTDLQRRIYFSFLSRRPVHLERQMIITVLIDWRNKNDYWFNLIFCIYTSKTIDVPYVAQCHEGLKNSNCLFIPNLFDYKLFMCCFEKEIFKKSGKFGNYTVRVKNPDPKLRNCGNFLN